jgi:hypothetical protein
MNFLRFAFRYLTYPHGAICQVENVMGQGVGYASRSLFF